MQCMACIYITPKVIIVHTHRHNSKTTNTTSGILTCQTLREVMHMSMFYMCVTWYQSNNTYTSNMTPHKCAMYTKPKVNAPKRFLQMQRLSRFFNTNHLYSKSSQSVRTTPKSNHSQWMRCHRVHVITH